jgi:hypothetical protein
MDRVKGHGAGGGVSPTGHGRKRAFLGGWSAITVVVQDHRRNRRDESQKIVLERFILT